LKSAVAAVSHEGRAVREKLVVGDEIEDSGVGRDDYFFWEGCTFVSQRHNQQGIFAALESFHCWDEEVRDVRGDGSLADKYNVFLSIVVQHLVPS